MARGGGKKQGVSLSDQSDKDKTKRKPSIKPIPFFMHTNCIVRQLPRLYLAYPSAKLLCERSKNMLTEATSLSWLTPPENACDSCVGASYDGAK